MNIRRRSGLVWKVALLTLALSVLPASAFAANVQPLAKQDTGSRLQGPFSVMIDLQPGAINGQVVLEPISVSVQASLADPGVDGQLQVIIPGQFVGSGSVSNGDLSYDLAFCGAGVNVALSGTHGTNVHVGFQDAASNPNACSGSSTAAQAPLVMRQLEMAAQSQPPGLDFDAQALLVNWLRRLVGFSLVAFLLVLLIPAMPKALAIATEAPPWARIGMGLAVALILPLLGVLLFAIGLPVGLWWLGVILLALYLVLLILSMSVSGLALGSWLSRRMSRPGVPIVLAFAVGMIVLTFVSLLPYVGPFINIAAVTFGLGTLVLAPRSKPSAMVDPTSGVQPRAVDPPATPPATSEPIAA